MSGKSEKLPGPHDLEVKLLEILNKPDLFEELAESVDTVEDDGVDALTEDQRATLTTLMSCGMPGPEELIRDAKMAEHNAKVQQKRNERIARRKERKAKHRRR